MNYNHFLNNNSKFKNKNRYRLESKKKNSRGFLLFSAVSVAVLIGSFTLLSDNKDSVNQVVNNVTAKPSSIIPSASHAQNIPLDLPEIGYNSEVLSKSVTYIEPIVESKFETKVEPIVNVEVQVQAESKNNIDNSSNKRLVSNNDVPEKIENALLTSEDIAKNKTPTVTISEEKAENNDTAIALNQADTSTVDNSQDLKQLAQTNTKTVVVKKGDTLSAIFKRLSISASTLHKIINSSKEAKQLTRIKPGQKLIITFNEKNKLQSLQYALDRIDTLVINKETNNSKFITHIDSKEIEIRQQFATGTITNSLFSTGNKVGLSNAMIMKLAQLFGWDVDFALDIRKGDSFAILFEEKYIDDKKIGNGNILSAEFVNRGKTFKAIRYTDASGHTDYYSEKGLSMRKAFLRTPVDFSRISSKFSSGRKHPVLNRIRAHKGVDYAAARGTPIKAVGNGKVIFKGTKGGYGRVIILQHGSKYSTLYAHMNSYNRKLKRGSRVEQGQTIGYVGSSGLATGPHLHYEFRMNGVQRNPLTVPLPSASPIAKKYRTDFRNTADTLISQLKSRQQETVALSEQ